ncbi:MAG TPA: adenylate/guanylate cyclase domain-containing protein [Polyangiaceae bacterium]|nr:adenylate/guanylate cyclase domain-containing protein [Polyangiaceae bacterium]
MSLKHSTCPSCGTALSLEAKFCSECGTKAPLFVSERPPPPGERRQVTILFADITGYTRLSSEIDPEELHALLGKYFGVVDRLIQDFGGKVDKHIGDAVMGVFGAPVSHGNDPERAVRAALGIHRAMEALSAEIGRTISVHIGVANGEVVAAATGSDVHSEYTVLGDAVNLASRLDGLARGGETMISHRVHQAVADLVEAESRGEVPVKGLAEPVRVYRVLGLARRGDAFRTPFVGRKVELARFSAVLSEAAAGRGSLVSLRGDPGIGKSRLGSEMRREAARAGFRVHSGLILDFGTGRDQDAVRSVVRSALDLALDSSLEEREAALGRALGEGLLDSELASPARDLLNLPQPPAIRGAYEALSETRRAEVRRRTVATLVERTSARAPVLVLLEDVHWADPPTLDALAELTVSAARHPLVVLVTTRVDGDPLNAEFFAKTRDTPHTVLDLSPLDDAATRELGQELSAVDSRRLAACVERSGGNPLFLEQLLLSDAEGALPDTVQSLVQARMDRLNPMDKRALQAASAIGQRFSIDVVRHLIQEPRYECTELSERNLVRREGEDWMFSHALVRDGVYSSLLRQVRRDLHRRAATWFGNSDPGLRAEHLDRAEDDSAPRAYLDAARERLESFDYDEALRLLRRGAELARTERDHHDLAQREGDILLYRADSAGALACFRRAAAHAASAQDRCRAHIGMADACRIVEASVEARAHLAQAEALLEPHGMDAERSRLHRIAGSVKFTQGEDSQADQELALEHALRAGDLELEARALSCLGDAYYMVGRVHLAHEHFSRCIELCDRHALHRVGMYQYYMLGITKWLMGDLRGGVRSVDQGVELSARAGHVRAEMIARETVALLLIDAGDYARALSEIERALALALRMGSTTFLRVLFAAKAETLLLLGREAEARDVVKRLEDAAQEAWWFLKPVVAGVQAWLAPTREAMTAVFEALEKHPEAAPGGMMMLLFHSRAADVCLMRNEGALALHHARALVRAEPDARYYLDQAERVSALVAFRERPGDPELRRRVERVREAARAAGMGRAVGTIDHVVASVSGT